MTTAPPRTLRELVGRYTAAQLRTVDVARELFADHGVAGTSLQDIADALGVTKAAVYHQFPTKEAILLGVIEVDLVPVEDALHEAEASGPGPQTRDALLERMIDIVVGNRRALSTLQRDPALFRLLGEHEPSRHLWARLFPMLLGADLGRTNRVRAAVLSAAIGAVAHPFVIDLDNDTVREELLAVTRALIRT